jgi:hypothetical protein
VLQLVGFGSSSSHSNLQAEFACAAAEDGSSGEHEPGPAATAEEEEEAAAAAKPTRGGRGSRKAAAGTAAKSKRTGSSKAAAAEQAQQQVQEMPGSAWLAEVLALLPDCAQQSLLLKEACSMLSSRLQAWGAVHSAAALLQLSLGKGTSDSHCDKHVCMRACRRGLPGV